MPPKKGRVTKGRVARAAKPVEDPEVDEEMQEEVAEDEEEEDEDGEEMGEEQEDSEAAEDEPVSRAKSKRKGDVEEDDMQAEDEPEVPVKKSKRAPTGEDESGDSNEVGDAGDDGTAEAEISPEEAAERERERLAAEAAQKAAEKERKAAKEAEKAEKKRQEEEEAKQNEVKRELEKFWKAVKEDPADFTGWTYLLQFVDTKNNLESGREAYTAFLQRYPYCYGYWKKFSDFEKRNGTPEDVIEVFNKGMKAIPLSVDLWIHFLNHVKASEEHKDNPDFIRQQYERAVEACGKEWRSDKLWDHYVKYEAESKNWIRVYQLYMRILRNPTQGLSLNFEKFRDFVKEQHPKDLMETAEFLVMRKEVLASLKGGEDGEEAEEKPEGEGGEGAAPGEETADQVAASDEETQAMREKIVFGMKKFYKETEEKVNIRWKYEEGIKRPYFHVKPLERNQLKNWHEYLEFTKNRHTKEEIDVSEVEIMYERCLIACALYEEFWMNYVTWLESLESVEGLEMDVVGKIRHTFERACNSHLPTKVDIHARWAAFEEKTGNCEKSGEILEKLEKGHPELVSLQLRRINLERRRGNSAVACELYETCITNCTQPNLLGDLSIKYSRLLRLHLRNTEKAKEVIATALEKQPTNVKLYLQMLDILLHTLPINVAEVLSLFDKALSQDFKMEKHKYLFSQRKVEFLEDFGTDISILTKAQKEHNELAKKLKLGSGLNEDMDETADVEKGKNISTLNTGGKDKSNGGATAAYPPLSNSTSYTAQHTQAYNNHSSRYAQYPSNYNYGGPYYQGYGGYGSSGY